MSKEASIKWHGIRVVDNGELEAMVREDMRSVGIDMRKPKHLIIHTVFLSDDIDGPTVAVWGRKKRFHAEYNLRTEWVTINELGGSAA